MPRIEDLFPRLKDTEAIAAQNAANAAEHERLRAIAISNLKTRLDHEPTEAEVHVEMIREHTSAQVDQAEDDCRMLLDRPLI